MNQALSSVETIKTDFLVLGAGIAGLSAAYHLSEHAKTIILSKGSIKESSTAYAQGGIAAALKDGDTPALHFEDTMSAGDGLCDEKAVRILVEEGPRRVKELIDLGANFDRYEDGFSFTKEAAHSKRRILHAGDQTGLEIEKTLGRALLGQKNSSFFSNTTVIQLLIEGNRVIGCLAKKEEKTIVFLAKATILATGGAGQVFLRNTNPSLATGDGIALACLAGCEIADMAFMQFHPTTLFEGDKRPISLFLISEALRGEGAWLRNSDGDRFMTDYDHRLELAPRDIVSRAIFSEMKRLNTPHVYLDATPIKQDLETRFPTIHRRCLKSGIDWKKDWIPVAPAAHYLIGGVKTDCNGKTSLEGFFACGEVASTGIHGANRLASNSLLEGLVFGCRVANYCLDAGFKHKASLEDIDEYVFQDNNQPCSSNEAVELATIRHQIREVMSSHVGIVRDAKGLLFSQKLFNTFEMFMRDKPNSLLCNELKNMLKTAQLMVSFALQRQESRGTHFRSDYPKKDHQYHDVAIYKDKQICFLERRVSL